jgi:hypothetical protein
LLELGLRLLASGPFLTELLLRCGERGGLAHQGRPQPLRILGLLLVLALPGPCPPRGPRGPVGAGRGR